jgi:hypothetical protein
MHELCSETSTRRTELVDALDAQLMEVGDRHLERLKLPAKLQYIARMKRNESAVPVGNDETCIKTEKNSVGHVGDHDGRPSKRRRIDG